MKNLSRKYSGTGIDMEEKYTKVVISGKTYLLAGNEQEEYLQNVAAYIDDKINDLKAQPGFGRQSLDFQNLLLHLNMADDYFKSKEENLALQDKVTELEKELYTLKRELTTARKRVEAWEKEEKEWQELWVSYDKKLDKLKKELNKLKGIEDDTDKTVTLKTKSNLKRKTTPKTSMPEKKKTSSDE